jgi:hypothetical protein
VMTVLRQRSRGDAPDARVAGIIKAVSRRSVLHVTWILHNTFGRRL